MKISAKIKVFGVFLALSQFSNLAGAETLIKLEERSQLAAGVLESVVSIPDKSIPTSLLDKATCVATVPDVIRVGFVFGARFGRGLVSCRVPGGWSSPSFIQLAGGSWGLQFGIESVDLVMVFTKANAIEKFSKNNFTIGVDATVAAGPLGRDAQAGTDYKLDSEIYSYSRSRGLFAGLMIQGTSISIDHDGNSQVYGPVQVDTLLKSDGRSSPVTVMSYVRALTTFAH